MKIKRKSPLTGKINEMEIAVTEKELQAYANDRSLMIQDAFPNLSPAEREFIKTGFTQSDWDAMFGGEE